MRSPVDLFRFRYRLIKRWDLTISSKIDSQVKLSEIEALRGNFEAANRCLDVAADLAFGIRRPNGWNDKKVNS